MKEEFVINEPPANVAIVLENGTCVYCGMSFEAMKSTKEHVIGKRFVPKGTLDGEWNLIVRACERCNHEKGKLEDDISAITMQPDAWGQHATVDSFLPTEAARKGRSKSQRTGKPVKDSAEHLSIDVPLGPSTKMGLGFTGPAQLEDDRAFKLALLHSRGFFYWVTYNKATAKGGFWPGGFFTLLSAPASDWGNPLHRSFVNAVSGWELRVLGVSPKGFFKVAIRRDPATVCWSWAYEWNQRSRIIGFFGDEAAAQNVVNTLSPMPSTVVRQDRNEATRYRTETPLMPEPDRLFSP